MICSMNWFSTKYVTKFTFRDKTNPFLSNNHDFRLEPGPCAKRVSRCRVVSKVRMKTRKGQNGRNSAKNRNGKKRNKSYERKRENISTDSKFVDTKRLKRRNIKLPVDVYSHVYWQFYISDLSQQKCLSPSEVQMGRGKKTTEKGKTTGGNQFDALVQKEDQLEPSDAVEAAFKDATETEQLK